MVRHGESTWNADDKLTGQADVPLTELGRSQARTVAQQLLPFQIESAFVSTLVRAEQTLEEIQLTRNSGRIPVVADSALNERDFGNLTGMLKTDLEQLLGKDAFHLVVKGWDKTAPEGESLKDVHGRVTRFFETVIRPGLSQNKTTLVVSHHQTLRALVKHLEQLSDESVVGLRVTNGEILDYEFGANGEVVNKKILS